MPLKKWHSGGFTKMTNKDVMALNLPAEGELSEATQGYFAKCEEK
jgi:hypothetical protein